MTEQEREILEQIAAEIETAEMNGEDIFDINQKDDKIAEILVSIPNRLPEGPIKHFFEELGADILIDGKDIFGANDLTFEDLEKATKEIKKRIKLLESAPEGVPQKIIEAIGKYYLMIAAILLLKLVAGIEEEIKESKGD